MKTYKQLCEDDKKSFEIYNKVHLILNHFEQNGMHRKLEEFREWLNKNKDDKKKYEEFVNEYFENMNFKNTE